MIRLVSELVWAARRAGLEIPPPKVADLARALSLQDWSRPDDFRLAARAVLAASRDDATRLEEVFARFFDPEAGGARTLAGSLAALGLATHEVVAVLRATLAAGDLGAATLLGLLEGPFVVEGLLSRRGREILGAPAGAAQIGNVHMALREALGLPRAEHELARIAVALRGAFGDELGEALTRLFGDELARASEVLRAHVTEVLDAAPIPRGPLETPFAALSADEEREIERAMAELARTLRGAARTRERRRRRGRLDVSRLRREAERTLGVPMRLPRWRRRRDRPRLFLLIDLSDSARPAARIFLAAARALGELFRETRVFGFVREAVECTDLTKTPEGRARLFAGELLDLSALSSYERAMNGFVRRHLHELDRRATVIVLGDGRTNRGGAGTQALQRVRRAARETIFLASEPRSRWGTGDSEVPRIARVVDRVLPASTAHELRQAVRTIAEGA